MLMLILQTIQERTGATMAEAVMMAGLLAELYSRRLWRVEFVAPVVALDDAATRALMLDYANLVLA
jgi:hypothetical protein